MIKEIELNDRIVKKINNSKLDESVKKLIVNLLKHELIGDSSTFSNYYRSELDKAYILIKRKQND